MDGLRDTWVTRVKWVSRDTWVCEDSPRTLDSPSVGSKRCVFGKIVLVEVSCLIRALADRIPAEIVAAAKISPPLKLNMNQGDVLIRDDVLISILKSLFLPIFAPGPSPTQLLGKNKI